MTNLHKGLAAIATLALWVPSVAMAADPAADAQSLREAQQQMDNRASTIDDQKQTEALEKEFAASRETVQGLRDRHRNQGWGEITVLLAMAQTLKTQNAAGYPDQASALRKIEELRGQQSKGWDQIAQELNFQLAPVVTQVQKIQAAESAAVAQAVPSGEAQSLRQAQQDIDNRASTIDDQKQMEALEKEFGASRETIQGLRDRHRNQGWGEITILMAMAQTLKAQNASAYPDHATALRKVEELRGQQSKGWDQVARELTLQLAPVVTQVQRIQQANPA